VLRPRGREMPLALSVECCFVGGFGSGQRASARGGGWDEREAAAAVFFPSPAAGALCADPHLCCSCGAGEGEGAGDDEHGDILFMGPPARAPPSAGVRLSSVATVVTSND
jgi:hypothetical protein